MRWIALGGDDTQSVNLYLSEHGVPSVGVPKTIDNDINGTDQTFGFDTAVMIATEAIDRIHIPPIRTNRVVVVEVMAAMPAGSPTPPAWPAART